MIWFLIEYLYEGEIWPYDVKASCKNEAIDLFKRTDIYQSGECTIKSISIMNASQARIAQKNYARIMSNNKTYAERLEELEMEDDEFKTTPLYRRLLQFYRERMETTNNEGVS